MPGPDACAAPRGRSSSTLSAVARLREQLGPLLVGHVLDAAGPQLGQLGQDRHAGVGVQHQHGLAAGGVALLGQHPLDALVVAGPAVRAQQVTTALKQPPPVGRPQLFLEQRAAIAAEPVQAHVRQLRASRRPPPSGRSLRVQGRGGHPADIDALCVGLDESHPSAVALRATDESGGGHQRRVVRRACAARQREHVLEADPGLQAERPRRGAAPATRCSPDRAAGSARGSPEVSCRTSRIRSASTTVAISSSPSASSTSTRTHSLRSGDASQARAASTCQSPASTPTPRSRRAAATSSAPASCQLTDAKSGRTVQAAMAAIRRRGSGSIHAPVVVPSDTVGDTARVSVTSSATTVGRACPGRRRPWDGRARHPPRRRRPERRRSPPRSA